MPEKKGLLSSTAAVDWGITVSRGFDVASLEEERSACTLLGDLLRGR